MELFCPRCMGTLMEAEDGRLRCSLDGGTYQVLFRRELACPRHPGVPAVAICGQCGAGVCETCAFPYPDGRLLCPDCAVESPVGKTPLAQAQRRLSWSLGLAGVSTLTLLAAFVVVMAAGTGKAVDSLCGVALLVMLACSIAGVAFGLQAREQRARFGPAVGIAIGWNALLLVLVLVITIAGLVIGGQ